MLRVLAVLLAVLQEEPASEELARLREALSVTRQPWAAIPWETSLAAARKRAADEGKPIFLQVNTGNPIGFV